MNRNVGVLGGDLYQVHLANLLGEMEYEVYCMFLESPFLCGKRVHRVEDFRDALYLCATVLLPDPVCSRGQFLNAPLWPGRRPVEIGQFLSSIGKGVLLLGGRASPEVKKAAASREVALTLLPDCRLPDGSYCWELYQEAVLAAMRQRGRL